MRDWYLDFRATMAWVLVCAMASVLARECGRLEGLSQRVKSEAAIDRSLDEYESFMSKPPHDGASYDRAFRLQEWELVE